jgi:hypothetical protein
MKKRIAILLAAICALSLCFVLAGCNSESNKAESKFIGEWALIGAYINGETIYANDIAELGVYGTLTLSKDGTFEFEMGSNSSSEKYSGNWSAKNDAEATLTIDSETSLNASLSDEVLTLDDGNAAMMLHKL